MVVQDKEEIVGGVEIRYAHEPEPFGRYGHLELLELAAEVMDDEVEDWVLDQCPRRPTTSNT